MNSVLLSKETEIDLIEKIKLGDQHAFTILVERYRKMVAKTVIGMLGNTAEADDIGQDVFIRFHQSSDQFRGESSIGTYLTRIAINLSLNELKRRKRRGFLFFNRDNVSHVEIDVADEDRFEDEMDRNELVEKALSTLEPKFRSVVVLRLIQGYSTRETAEMLNLPQGTVLSRLARAQDKLKEIVTLLMHISDE